MGILDSLLKRPVNDRIHVTDPKILEHFLSNPDFPWLISFPRTGSHWLRMLMELYFQKPSLRRIFFYPDATDFTCYHWHDVDLTTHDVKSVIYLYRHPVDTVYSLLRYHKENTTDAQRVRHWTDVYARHLAKWLWEESFTIRRTVIRYESLRTDLNREFAKVCEHLGVSMDTRRLQEAVAKVSKDRLKNLTQHDGQVVDLSPEYETRRTTFQAEFGTPIMEQVAAADPRLQGLWSGGDVSR